MGEPKAITYKEVKKAVGDEGSLEAWWKIGEITGAGHVSVGAYEEASIDLTESSEAVRSRVDKVLGIEAEPAAETNKAAANNKKEGK